jgi:DNA repair protein RecO (recombination protein O)
LFVAEGRNFYVLQETSVINSYPNLKSSLNTIKYAYYIFEIVDALLPENEVHSDVYSLLLQILQILETHPRKIFIRAFEVKLMSYLGYLAVDPEELMSGNVSGSEFLSEASVIGLTLLQQNGWQEIEELDISEKDAKRIEQFMRFRIERESQKTIKSLDYFD